MSTDSIWIIDDDTDDHEMVTDIFKELNLQNELVFITDAEEAIRLLEQVDEAPFMIICDVNLPKINGFELRERILESPEKIFHSVPFIFWSTYASEAQITKAFDLSAHGFFIKESNFEDLKASFIGMIQYWQRSKKPAKRV